MTRLALAAALALTVAACVPPQPQPTGGVGPSPSPSGAVSSDMTAALAAKALPEADAFDLVRRMKGRDGTPAKPFEPVRTTPPDEQVGSTASFWVYDFDAKRNVRTEATLRVLTASVKWWVANDVTVDAAALQKSAQTFQDSIYPTDRRLFGSEWSPGIDADPRIDVLIAKIPGAAAGYFSSADELPRWVNEFSAEREMIYINALDLRPNTDAFHSVLAHEFCHMIQFARGIRSSTWFNEGQAQVCERANGHDPTTEAAFLRAPDTQLDTWVDLDQGAREHYGAAYLFLQYLRARTGGDERFIGTLMSRGVNTSNDVDAALRAEGLPPFRDVLADWVAANALIGASPPAPYAYPADAQLQTPARAASADRAAAGSTFRSSAHPQATRYVQLPLGGRYTVTFQAPDAVRVIPTDAHSGRAFWWSDRADEMDSTLTRTVDLTGTTKATLSFWTWYDIEKDFDYGYVAVSADGGARWTTLATPATTTSDPNGNNLGNGLTGASGGGKEPAWIQQTADLSAFAGKRVLLRFEQVTDAALNLAGFAVDDIEIPEIGYRDDAEADNGWDAKGFIRSTNVASASYVLQVLHLGAPPSVERTVTETGAATVEVDASADGQPPLLAVTPFVARSTEPIAFDLTVSAKH